jgi:peptide/nickel transport system permease protein
MSDIAASGLSRPGVSRFRIGVIAALLFLLLGFVSVVWTPYPIGSVDVAATLQEPSGGHWFGTDALGRDMLSMTMKSVLTSFVVAAVGVAIGVIVGVPLGVAAASLGDVADKGVLGLSGFLLTFPALILAMLVAGAFGPSIVGVMVAVGVFNIPIFARATRDSVLAVRAFDYVEAAQLAGTGPIETIRRHMLPSLLPLFIATAVAQVAVGVLAEAGLSFVGLGAQPPTSSIGLMLHDAQNYALAKPSLMLAPGLVLVLIVIALNLTAGGLRELLDPRLRRIEGTHGAA